MYRPQLKSVRDSEYTTLADSIAGWLRVGRSGSKYQLWWRLACMYLKSCPRIQDVFGCRNSRLIRPLSIL